MNIKNEIEKDFGTTNNVYLNNIDIDCAKIKVIMINEVVPDNPKQDFYEGIDTAYFKSTILLFNKTQLNVNSMQNILDKGIYITNAVKKPKTKYMIDKEDIDYSLPYLEKEINLFPNVKVIMLMGDVAKKMFNAIVKKNIKKNVIPSLATYKIRNQEFYYKDIRVIPSYIMTGSNLLIEKSKVQMVVEDIEKMIRIIE